MVHPPIPLERRDWLAALGLAALVLVAGACRMTPGVCGIFHDDAIYVSTARALAEGKGYRLTGVPGAPLQTKYPPVYPAMLAGVCWLWPAFPANLLAMQGLTLLCGAAAVGLAYLYLVRFGYFSRGVAAAAGVLCATAPFFLYFCVQTMAEMPFALLTVVALWAVERQLHQPAGSRLSQFGLGLLLALPFLCRTIGAPFAVVGLWVLFRSGRPVRWCLAGMTLTVLPWLLWGLLGRGIWDRNPVDGYYTDYLGCWSSTGLGMTGRVFAWNALMVADASAGLGLEGLSVAEPYLAPAPWHALLIAVGLVPWLAVVPHLRQGRALAWALAAYLLVMLFWPWPPHRFLMPILPFLVAYLLAGLAALLRRLLPAAGYRRLMPVGLGVLLLANLWLLACHVESAHRSGYPMLRLTLPPPNWSSYERAFAWLRQHTQPDDVLASGLDSMIALNTDRPAVRPFVYRPGRHFYGEAGPALGTVEELASVLKRYQVRYLVQVPMTGFTEEKPFDDLLVELRRRHPDWLVPVYEDEGSQFTIFELDSRKEPAGAPTP